MPWTDSMRRRTAASPSFDYPPARSSHSDSSFSEDFEWTADDPRPLTESQRPHLAPETIEHINPLRAERSEIAPSADSRAAHRSGTWSRSAEQNAEEYIRQAEAAVAAARYPRESHTRTPVYPTHTSHSRSRMRRVLSNIRNTEAAFQEVDPYPPRRRSNRPYRSANRRWRADPGRGQMSHRMEDRDFAELHERGQRLAQQNEDISTLIASTPGPPPRHGTRRRRSVSFDTSPQQDRRKRRRIDDISAEVQPKIEYGWWGQVVPGKLQMHIASSDGETMGLPSDRIKSFSAENILRDDPTIYCTMLSACNIVLRHEGETPFSLERLVIKTPVMDCNDSVQEGLIFVSMQRDEKFNRTTTYKILHFPESYFGRFYPHAKNHRHHRKSSVSDPNWPSLEPAHAGLVPKATAVLDTDQTQVDSNVCPDDPSSDDDTGLESAEYESDSEATDMTTSQVVNPAQLQQRGDTPLTYRTFFEEERSREDSRFGRRPRFPRPYESTDQAQQDQDNLERDLQRERDIGQVVAQGEQTRQDRLDRQLNRALSTVNPQQSHGFPPPPPALRRAFAQRLQDDLNSTPLLQGSYPNARSLDATDQALYRQSVLDMGRSEGTTPSSPPHMDQLRPRSIDIGGEPLPPIGSSAWNERPVTLPGGPSRSAGNHVASPLQNVAGIDDLQPEAETTDNKFSKDLQLLTPAARFTMRPRSKKGKYSNDANNTMTIQFDPPISGKYILLKLWNPQKDRNIDIQEVAAHGFAGPRYFPAWEFA